MTHRTDIDGLRGLAVLAVFAGHLGLSGVPGGFVGVDVFFVVSGFVIARVVSRRQGAGQFSLIDFWERRTRRLLPAVLVVIAAATVMAMIHMFPDELVGFARSGLSTLAFSANLYFWRTIDYFAAPPDMHPLLHAWSLGVEEQFYIVFPLLMVLGWRWFPGRLRTVLACLALISFGAGVWMAKDMMSAGFYLPIGRAWELLLGVLLAQGAIPAPSDRRVRSLMGVVGLGLILGAMALYQPWTAMPGTAALVPCAGAMLLLMAGEDTPTGALLSIPPLRFYGQISYSLYLWHWPLISFQRMLFGEQAGGLLTPFAVFAAAVVLATLSWRFVETPIRDRRDGLSTGRFYMAALAATLVVAAPLVLILATNGLPGRFSPRVYAIAGSAERTVRHTESCLPPPDGPLKSFPAECLQMAEGEPDWLLAGDSHANHLWYGLSEALPGVNLMQATVSNCRMTLTPAPSATDQCRRVIASLYGDILVNRPPERLYLAGLWRPGDETAVAETLAWLKARRIEVVLIGPAPSYEQSLPRLLALAEHLKDPDLPARRRRTDSDRMEPLMAATAGQADVPYLSILALVCPDGVCRTRTPDGRPMQWDAGHLSRSGSLWVGAGLIASEPKK